MANEIILRNLIQKSLRNTLTPEEQNQLDNWNPVDFQRLIAEEFADAEEFKREFSLFLQIESQSAQMREEFLKKHFLKAGN